MSVGTTKNLVTRQSSVVHLAHSRETAKPDLVAASTAGTRTLSSRLFYVKDRNSGLRFLVDTGAEVSLLPASAYNRNNQPIGLSFQAANNMTIPTYGSRSPISPLIAPDPGCSSLQVFVTPF